jgi:hypothetical protein
VYIASVKTIQAAHFEQEVMFTVEVFGKPFFLPIRHRTPISCVEDYSRIFELHALAEFDKKAQAAFHNSLGRHAVNWLRKKIEHGE